MFMGGTVDPDLVMGVGNVVTSSSTFRDCKRREGWTPGPCGSNPPSISAPAGVWPRVQPCISQWLTWDLGSVTS